MFQVGNSLLSDDVATARFACNLTACKGACCVIGTAGAPVKKKEVTILKLAYKVLKDTLPSYSVQAIEKNGLIKESQEGLELQCSEDGACVFVIYDENQTALCSIQKAYQEGIFSWEKPISCHLFPIRIKSIGNFDYVNFEFIPELCSPAPDHARKLGIYLSDFLNVPLIRLYGSEWYKDFKKTCREIRALVGIS